MAILNILDQTPIFFRYIVRYDQYQRQYLMRFIFLDPAPLHKSPPHRREPSTFYHEDFSFLHRVFSQLPELIPSFVAHPGFVLLQLLVRTCRFYRRGKRVIKSQVPYLFAGLLLNEPATFVDSYWEHFLEYDLI